MDNRNDLATRMKTYEFVTREFLPRRTYTIIRVDGRGFHQYTRNLDKPFDYRLMTNMDQVAKAMCQEIPGARMAYVQSDEISILFTDFATIQTEPWFGGNLQKIVSISASLASVELNSIRGGKAMFDSRVFTISDPVEVANYFIWRQQDAVRNSISMVAQSLFSHKELHGLNSSQLQEKIFQEGGINWNNFALGAKNGRVVVQVPINKLVKTPDGEKLVVSKEWRASGAPKFVAEAGSFIAERIPSLPTLTA